jgi:hypothetical protein
MNKVLIIFLVIFNILAVTYLSVPLPHIPDLTNSVRSTLPGDTTQLKNVSGYFTNLSRTEVITFYKANLNGPLRIQLNHPPEKAKEVITDTIQSYYLEEFVFPFKGSVFINGYDWQNDVFTKPEKRIANKLIYNGAEYQSKITVKSYPTTLVQRLIGFFGSEILLIAICWCYQSFLKKHE